MKIGISTNKFNFILTEIKLFLENLNYQIIEINNGKKIDIFDASVKIAELIEKKEIDRGIIIDEYGNGGFIIASKFPNTIVAQLSEEHSAHMTMEHNNSNIITLGANLTSLETMKAIVKRYLETNFAAGRHMVRIDMMNELIRKEDQ